MAARKRTHKIIDADANGNPLPEKVSSVDAKNEAKGGTPGYFKRVISNLKGRDIDVTLGAATAFVSPNNRAGKTAVLDSIRLALTGKHPIGPHAVDFAGLTADGSMPRAQLIGASAEAMFEFPSGTKTPVLQAKGDFMHFSAIERAEMLPLSTWRELLFLGAAKAREELFRRFGDNPQLDPAKAAPLNPPSGAALAASQLALWEKAVTAAGAAGDTVERLAAAGSWLRSHKLTLGKRLKALEDEKKRLHDAQLASGVGLGTDDLLPVIEQKIAAHTARHQTELLRTRAQESESRLIVAANALFEIIGFPGTPNAMDVDQYLLHLNATNEKALIALGPKFDLERLQHDADEAQKVVENVENNLRVFKLVEHLQKLLPTSGCFVCGQPPHAVGLASLANIEQALHNGARQLEEARQARQHCLDAREHGLAAYERERTSIITATTAQRAKFERAVADVKFAQQHHVAAQEMLKAASIPDAPAEPMATLQRQRDELLLAKQSAGRGAAIATEMREITTEQTDVSAVQDVLTMKLDQLVLSVRTAAEAAVNKWMPPGFTAKLSMQDADGKPDCAWCVIGADGRPHPLGAMSGAEQAALTVAIACAWSEGQRQRFLLLDDADIAGFSEQNLKLTLTMLAEAVAEGRLTQVFVAWSRPAEIPSKGWSVVSL